MQVNIYIECDNSFQETEKKYGYVLQCFTKKGERTREGFGKLTGTIHKVTLHAILKALERMKQPSEINIYTKNTYIANMFDHYLPDWAMHDFKKVRKRADCECCRVEKTLGTITGTSYRNYPWKT